MVAPTCPTPRKDGGQCTARPNQSGFCYVHDPALDEKRRQAWRKGGKGKSLLIRAQKLIPPNLQVLDTLLDRVVADVYRGSLAPSQGTAIASLVGAKVRIREISLKLREQTELAERLERLEEKIEELGNPSHSNGKGSGHSLLQR
jgi:hypothetical protein